MEKHLSKLQTSEQREALAQQQQEQQQSQAQNTREFASVEEMIRCDAAQTQAPPQVEERLRQSLAREPQPTRSWWRRWFDRGGQAK